MILLLVILLVILLLVIPHELGHFFAAKWFRVRVEEFGIGIPPRLWGKKIGETFYSLNLLPLGAFVRLFGEEGDSEDPRSFSGQKIWKKSVVVGAGVFANIFIGFLIFSFLAWYGEPQIGAEISSIAQGSPADTAGLEPGDIIIGIDAKNDAPPDIPTVLQYIDMHRGQGASFFIDRQGERLYIEATPRSSPPPGEGALGIAIADHDFGLKRVPWYRAPIDGFSTTLKIFWLTLKGLAIFFGDLFTKAKLSGEVIGPVGIAKVATDIFRTSLTYFLELLGLLTINLAVFNIFPIPPLDGGHLLFFAVEKIRGSPVPARVAQVVHSLFLFLFIALFLWITYRDILRLI